MSETQGKKKKGIRKRTIYAIILIIMLACLIMIGFLLLFQVRKIEIKGTQYLAHQEIADWINEDELAANSVYLLWKYNFTDCELLPAMEDVKVRMKNPWTVVFDIKEKRIAGYITLGDDCAYFDKDGIVLARTREWWEDVPCIEGLSVTEVTLYEELPVSEENKRAFEGLLNMSATLKKYELKPDKIVCSGADLYLYFGNKCVILGSENLSDRIAQIKPILEKLGEQSGTLHLERYDEDNMTSSFDRDVLPEIPVPKTEDAAEGDGNGTADQAGDEPAGEGAGENADENAGETAGDAAGETGNEAENAG